MNNVQKFERYIRLQKKNGLKSFSVCLITVKDISIDADGNVNIPSSSGMTYEDFCEEFIRMLNAPDVLDSEIF